MSLSLLDVCLPLSLTSLTSNDLIHICPTCGRIGTSLALISCVCDPEVFVIGGGVSKAGEILINSVKKHYVENAFHASRKTDFKLAELGNDAGIFGGAWLVQDK